MRPKSRISTLLFGSRLKKIDGFIFCSHFIKEHFVRQYPLLEKKCSVAWNGLHTDEWAPRDPESRQKLIVFAGRCHPEKGAEESALAICEVLAKNPEWHAYMALSFPERHPDLYERICHLSRRHTDRFTVATDVKYNVIKYTLEKAAICLVPLSPSRPLAVLR